MENMVPSVFQIDVRNDRTLKEWSLVEPPVIQVLSLEGINVAVMGFWWVLTRVLLLKGKTGPSPLPSLLSHHTISPFHMCLLS
jgi:hypothetical protein